MRSNPNDSIAPSLTGFVRSGSSITVTIGRNVGTEPMSDERWIRFRADVVDHLSSLVKPSFTFIYDGVGEWEGVSEDSSAILLGETGYTASVADVGSVLSALARDYGQDAIGWSAGPAKLATA